MPKAQRALAVGLLLLSASLSAADVVRAKVDVRAVGGKQARDVYVAFVPMWRPSSRPVAEITAESGTASLSVPAGHYRLIAAAPGHTTAERVLTLSSVSANDITVALEPLKRVSGIVVDQQGNPIEGARVTLVGGAVLPPLDLLSELAVRQLEANLVTRTDERGEWTLGVPAGSVPLVVDAPGHAAQWQVIRETDADVVVALSAGATLRVITDRIDPEMILTLVRNGDPAEGDIPAGWQPQVLSRRVSATVTAWDSLAPGEYAIYAKYPSPRHFMQRGVKLGSACIIPREPREVRVTLPPIARPAGITAALFVQGLSWKDLTDGLEAFAVDAAAAPARVDHFVEDTIGGHVIHLKSEGVRAPFVAATAQHVFSTVPDLAAMREPPDDEPFRVVWHPRADASLHLDSGDEELHLPQIGTAVFHDCSKAKRVTVPIEIRGGNLARFTGPAGCRAVVLAFEPFEAVVLDATLRPGDQSLGTFVLRAGGGADVRVVREPGGAVVPGATVRVFAASDEQPDRNSTLVGEGTTGDDGWAHFSGLPVLRRLRVLAESPEREKSAAAELRLEPRARGVADPLAISEPATLILDARIDEALSARYPAARVMVLIIQPEDPWRQALEKRQEKVREERTPVRFEGLTPGRWLIAAVVSVAGTTALLDAGDVELRAGETRRLTSELQPVVFEGRVTSAGESVAARIIFRNPSARAGAVLQMSDSAQDGTWRAVLPARGRYSVQVALLSSQGDQMPVGEIDFHDPRHRVHIEVPATAVATAKVRAGGVPMRDVVVWASLGRDGGGRVEQYWRGRTSDQAGFARFEALVAGVWTFSVASKDGTRSAEKTVTLQAREQVEVSLDVGPSTTIEGTVRDIGGVPLPRARVECLLATSGPLPHTGRADSDAAGKFSIRISPSAPASALCSVTAPMGEVDAFRVVPGQMVDVTLPAMTATLEISDWAARHSVNVFWLTSTDGRVISLSTVAARIGGFGSPLRIPALAAGRWKLVRIESLAQWHALARGMGGSLATVADLTLEPGKTTRIQIYESAIP